MLQADTKNQLRVVHAGVKVFEKNPSKNGIFEYRLRQEGVPFLLPYMTKRVVKMNMVDFTTLLHKGALLMDNLTNEQAKTELKEMVGGCVLLLLDDSENKQSIENSVFMSGWRGNMQLTLFVSKFEQQALMHAYPKVEVPQAAENGQSAGGDQQQAIKQESSDAQMEEEVSAEAKQEPAVEVKEEVKTE